MMDGYIPPLVERWADRVKAKAPARRASLARARAALEKTRIRCGLPAKHAPLRPMLLHVKMGGRPRQRRAENDATALQPPRLCGRLTIPASSEPQHLVA
jgi:hypothetical protein